MIDFGSLAPMQAFVDTFAQFGVSISIDDARAPMGVPKLDHIRAIGALPHVAARWHAAGRGDFDENAAQLVFRAFLPRNRATLPNHADLIPGAADLASELRARGLKIGSTTGYTRDLMEIVLPQAARQGYAPDCLVCAGDTAEGRPSPLMMYRCFAELGVYPPEAVVKVDDTAPGIVEGKAAGTWTVGVTDTGNHMGLSPDAYRDAPADVIETRRAEATRILRGAGADYVVESVADLGAVLDMIERDGSPH